MAVISPDYFMLDGVSSATVGLYVDTPPVPQMAKQRYTVWQTGRDTDDTAGDDVFENITLTFNCYLFDAESFNLSEVYMFLQNKKALQFSRYPGRAFIIQQVGNVSPAQKWNGGRIKLSISFVCLPFKYHIVNEWITPENNVITNPGTRYSRPIYKITHSGACAIAVNNQVLQIAQKVTTVNADGTTTDEYSASPIYIDAEKMVAYDEYNTNQTKFTTGPFPYLSPGDNLVQVSGCTVQIQGNWRDY